ncbi:MAG TPA: hypothetical protein V6D47_02300 [Oscillatoriaceae cyanobacterium]
MRQFLLTCLLLSMLTGCSAVPGQAIDQTRWQWPPVETTPQLQAALTPLHDPAETARYLQRNFTFSENYDLACFLSPDEFVVARRGACTAYARFWLAALGHMGLEGHFVAIWGPTDSHAVAIFRDAAGRYRLASNDRYDGDLDLDPQRQGLGAAAKSAAQQFFGNDWRTILFFDDAGRISGRLDAAPLAAEDFMLDVH